MTQQGITDLDGSVDAIAAFWLVRLESEDCSPEDRYAFDVWRREDPEHEAAYLKIKRGNDYLDRYMDVPAFQARIELARMRTQPPLWRRKGARWAGAVAACLAFITVGAVLAPQLVGEDPAEPIEQVADATESYETRIGERSSVTLSDGTVVTINTNSRIEVDYTDAVREITLTRGQGFFDVAKDIDRPFVVLAGGKRVMALGTVFDVRFDDANEVEVTLVEGKVRVDDRDEIPVVGIPPVSGGDTPSGLRAIELNPGERLVARQGAAPEIIETDGIEETSWRRGQLVFRQRALSEVVAEMNRYSAQQLVLDADERVLALQVSGIFNNGGPSSAFLDALEAMHPLEARRSDHNEVTLVWRE